MNPKQRLLAACAAGIVITLYWLVFGVSFRGGTGVSIERDMGNRAPIVVAARSAAMRAGLRSGDVVTLEGLTPEQRWSYEGAVPRGSTVVYRVVRGDRTHDVAVVAEPRRLALWSSQFFNVVGHVWMLAFAIVLAARAGEQRRARYLAYTMLGWTVGNMLWHHNFWAPWLSLRVGVDVIDKVLDATNIVFVALFAATYGQPGIVRRRLTRVTIALAILNFALFMCATWLLLSGVSVTAFELRSVVYAAAELAAIACLGAGIAGAASERAALVWAAAPLSLIYLTQTVFLVTRLALGVRVDISALSIVGFLLTPVGLTYSVLSRRVVDIGFVLNRTLVYSALTTLIIGAFAGVEWAAGKWLGTATRAESAAFEAGLAIVLALSLRPLHARVEQVVELLFFRRRYDDERALREFAEEAPYITDPAVAAERAATMLRRHTDAATVAILVASDDGAIGKIDENDPALVRMRARRTIVDLHATDSALPGALGVPLIANGRLLGVIALGARASGEHVTPDERRTLAEVANGLALALAARAASTTFSIAALHEVLVPALRGVRDDLHADLLDALTSRNPAAEPAREIAG